MSATMQMLLASGGDLVAITNQTLSHLTASPSPCRDGYSLNADGIAYEQKQLAFAAIENWIVPNSAAPAYEVFVTVTAGTLSTGTAGSWLPLSSTQTWTVLQTSIGGKSATISVQIRKVGTTTILTTASISMTAEVV